MASRGKYDDIAAELDGMVGTSQSNKIEVLFGDSPKLLEAIRQARARHMGYQAIADFLTLRTGQKVGNTSVKNWLTMQGIK